MLGPYKLLRDFKRNCSEAKPCYELAKGNVGIYLQVSSDWNLITHDWSLG